MMFAIKVGAPIVGSLVVAGLSYLKFKDDLKQELKNKKTNSTKEEYKEAKKQTQKKFINYIKQASFTFAIPDKKDKKHVCFLGPISSGKSTLCNKLFGTNQQTGLGQCTKQATVVHQTNTKVFWDACGVNSDWDQYKQKDVCLFKSMDEVYLLYSDDVSQIRFIGQLLTQLNIKLILVRTKCDLWKDGQKPIDKILQEDQIKAQQYGIVYSKILPTGQGMHQQIQKTF